MPTGGSEPPLPFTVVICTKDRPAHVESTLQALARQSRTGYEVLVVDQTGGTDRARPSWSEAHPSVRVVPDAGRGLSRARNIAWRQLDTEWVVYLDDDCRPEPDWAEQLELVLRDAGGVDLVSGHVGGLDGEDPEYLEVATFPVEEKRVRTGRWTPPWDVGFGVCMAVRRTTIERLDGWDERLGVGSGSGFGAGEDMDFNYRLLRSGGTALATPRVRSRHEQWRTPEELVPLFGRYVEGWSGFATKQLRTGDVIGGAWLLWLGLENVLRSFAGAARRHSRLHLRIAVAKARGLIAGTSRGLRTRW